MTTALPLTPTRPAFLATWLRGVALIALAITAGCASPPQPAPANRVVLVVDASGSFAERQALAVERAAALLDAVAETPLHRWEERTDEIAVVSLDAFPEVIWTGTLRDLQEQPPTAWVTRFRARTDYAGCTDVDAAFRLGTEYLRGGTGPAAKYLFVFSDLVAEPPTTSMARCAPARSVPSGDDPFPWEALTDVSVTVLWAPADQKLRWARAAVEHGLTRFALHSESESAAIAVEPPPRPSLTATDAERADDRARLLDGVRNGLTVLGVVVAAFLAFVVGVALVVRRRSRRAPASSQ